MHLPVQPRPVVLLAPAPELGLSGVTAYVGALALAVVLEDVVDKREPRGTV